MTERTNVDGSPNYARGTTWYPLRSWWQPRLLFNQDFGPLSVLESRDFCWVEGLQRRRAATSWPGYLPHPLFTPSVSGSMHQINPVLSRAKVDCQSEPRGQPYMWRVLLDASHFTPSEITLTTNDGYLEIEGSHEERPDELGFITRCFTRKYRLPTGTDTTKITSTLSENGILYVEAPLPESFLILPNPSFQTIIPIQVEKETETKKKSKDKMEEVTDTHLGSGDLQLTSPESPAAPEFPVEHTTTDSPRHEVLSPPEGHEDGQSSNSPTDLESDLAREGEESTPIETHQSTPLHEDFEDLPEPSIMDGQDPLDTGPINKEEHPDQVKDEGEIDPTSVLGNAAEEIPHPEDLELGQSLPDESLPQELEYMEQEHTK